MPSGPELRLAAEILVQMGRRQLHQQMPNLAHEMLHEAGPYLEAAASHCGAATRIQDRIVRLVEVVEGLVSWSSDFLIADPGVDQAARTLRGILEKLRTGIVEPLHLASTQASAEAAKSAIERAAAKARILAVEGRELPGGDPPSGGRPGRELPPQDAGA